MLSPLTVGIVDTRTSMLVVPALKIDAPVLRQAFFGDVHARHDFQAGNDRALEQAELRRHGSLVEDAVDAVTDAQIVFQRLGRGCPSRVRRWPRG